MNYEAYKNERGEYDLPLGIYFDLPENIYHAVNALGSSSIKELARKPCKWQYDRLRPLREIEPEHFRWGHAWHCRVLEGVEEFKKRYAKPPSPSDHPEALNTSDQIKDFLRMHGKTLTGNKPALIERAKEVPDCPPFFDDILSAWMAEHPDHYELSERQVIEIEDSVANMQRDPTLAGVMLAGSLINGAAEMSIIWEDSRGLRRKCRFDYSLAPEGKRVKSLIVDLKSFTTYKGGTDEEAAIHKVHEQCYDMQVSGYMEGYFAGRELLANGRVYGTPPAGTYLHDFLHSDGVDWVWVMIRRDNGMLPVTLSVDTKDEMFERAGNIVSHALETYQKYMAAWGPDQLWTPPSRTPRRLNHTVMPTWNRGIQYEQPADR